MPLRSTRNPLGHALSALLKERGMTREEFCRKVHLLKTTLSMLESRAPTRLPKNLDLAMWTKALELSDRERRELKMAAELSWSPAGIQEFVVKLQRGGEAGPKKH